jgi:hypothetical protein
LSKSSITDKDHGWAALFRRVKEIESSYVRVGVLADDAKGGMRVPGGDLTIAEIAVVNEYGTEDKTIPARSFARSTFDEKREELVGLGKKLMTGVVDGKIGIKPALDVMGSTLANAMKRKIVDGAGVPPPNAPSTVAKKGSSRPLVDTGRLVNAITWASIVGGGKAK